MSSAAEAPAPATTAPPITGPSTNVIEKATFSAAFALRSASSAVAAGDPAPRADRLLADGARLPLDSARAVRASSERSSALAASAAVPSSATSSRIAGSQKCHSEDRKPAVTPPRTGRAR